MSEWEADVWSPDGNYWYARYHCGAVALCDGPGAPWVDKAKTEAKIRQIVQAKLEHLNPPPPQVHYTVTDERPTPSVARNPSHSEDKGGPPWPPSVGRFARRLFRLPRNADTP